MMGIPNGDMHKMKYTLAFFFLTEIRVDLKYDLVAVFQIFKN